MGAVEKISGAYKRDKAIHILHEAHKKNQFTLMPFRVFLAKRNKLGFGKYTQAAKAVSEEIDGNFDDQAISDAIYCYIASNADAAEKQIVANELAAKIIAMADSVDVILLAVSIS